MIMERATEADTEFISYPVKYKGKRTDVFALPDGRYHVSYDGKGVGTGRKLVIIREILNGRLKGMNSEKLELSDIAEFK